MIWSAQNEEPFGLKHLGRETGKQTREKKVLNYFCRNDCIETITAKYRRVVINTENLKLNVRISAER